MKFTSNVLALLSRGAASVFAAPTSTSASTPAPTPTAATYKSYGNYGKYGKYGNYGSRKRDVEEIVEYEGRGFERIWREEDIAKTFTADLMIQVLGKYKGVE